MADIGRKRTFPLRYDEIIITSSGAAVTQAVLDRQPDL